MKRIATLAACMLFTSLSLFPQIMGVSKNGNYIAINYNGVNIMSDSDGKALYEIPQGFPIGFTDDEKFFYYGKDKTAYIYNTADGKITDSLSVLGTKNIHFENGLRFKKKRVPNLS